MNRILLVPLTIILLTGCDSTDDRLIKHVAESNRQQSEQNKEMAKLNREVAEGTTQLVEAVADSRQELLDMERDIQSQRTQLDAERRSLANERHRESLLAPILSNLGLMLVCALPLILAAYLLHGLRNKDEEVNEVLIEHLIPRLPGLPGPVENVRAIEQQTPGEIEEEPPF